MNATPGHSGVQWQVSTTPGVAPHGMSLQPIGASTSLASQLGVDVEATPCLRLAGCDWPPGWYLLRGNMPPQRQPQAAPCMRIESRHAGRQQQVDLPYPRSNGRVCMLLQLPEPVDALSFCLGVDEPRGVFQFCRVSRWRALLQMLTGPERRDSWLARGRHSIRFVGQAVRDGLSMATRVLYDGYCLRVRNQSINAYIQRIANLETHESSHDDSTAAKQTDDVLAPFLIADSAAGRIQAQRLAREYRLLASSDLFDADYYLEHHPDVREAGLDPLLHFCQTGWASLCNPSADFDVWWYWSSHLDAASETINPLAHYALIGRAAGLETRPTLHRFETPGHVLPQGAQVRRACLFAGHDPDGIMDESVVAYLRELARHADVWYLADGDMRPGELEKLDGIVRGAWCQCHDAYDFGSWSRLARDRVGWDTLAAYDEVLLVNDSCYLLRTLDHVFARMNTKACDWWGMQATKGLYATRHRPSNRFRTPVPMERVLFEEISRYIEDYPYDFHVGSYFLALRKPVIADAKFRRLLDAVVPQENKANIIGKYEIGIGRCLLAGGHPFATFIDHLYPFHPVYSETAFTLIEKGFPFLKRYLLAENHYQVPHLEDWKERVLRLVPDARVDRAERHLLRTSNYEKLYRSLRVTRDRSGRVHVPELLDDKAFVRADASSAVHEHWWAFPVCAFTHRFTGNERALFEEVKDDPSIRKIVLTQTRHVDVDGQNVVVVPLRSRDGQQYLLGAGQIFIKHSPTRNIGYPVSSEKHNIINLWHGVPLKRIGYASLDMRDKLERLAAEHGKCRAVIAASRVDAMAMASAFYPLTYNDVWVTGLPRHDFITRDEAELPAHLREQCTRLDRLSAGRRLVLFMPTFKQAQGQGGYYHFQHAELQALQRWLKSNDAVLGVREHMADRARTYCRMLAGIGALDLGHERFPDVEMLYRRGALLITDYSSSFIDFMLTGKPMISFAYDYDHYTERERGLFYDMDFAFPGPVCQNFTQLVAALEHAFEEPDNAKKDEYAWKRRLFLAYGDDANAARVIRKIKALPALS